MDTYSVPFTCKNCKHEFTLFVPKGTTVKDHIVNPPRMGFTDGERMCENCGCRLLW